MTLALPGLATRLALTRRAFAAFTALLATGSIAPLALATSPPLWRPPVLQVAGAEQPVRLDALKVEVEIAGGVAETRVHMVFFNPNARILEGTLQFPLAPHQVVTGFALDVEGRMRDAVPVDKARAQQVFEDITRRRVDPGLLQTTLGNQHELRIYPLPPGKTRSVTLTIVEPAAAALRVPLAYAARVPSFELSIRHSGATTAPTLIGWPGRDLRFAADPRGGFVARTSGSEIALPGSPLVLQAAADAAHTVAIGTEERFGQRYFTLELPVPATHAPRTLAKRLQLVWDSSASAAARRLDRELALLDAYFAHAGDVAVNLVRVSDTAVPPQRFDVRGGDWRQLRRALQATSHDGASDLGAVRHDGVSTEALWFTDGLATYGAPWRLRFPVPVYAVSSALTGDPAALQALADATGGQRIDLTALSTRAAADALLQRGTELVGVTANGADGIVVQSQSAASGRLVLAGVLSARSAEVTVRLREANGRVITRSVRVDAGQNPSRLAAVQWARLTLASLAGEARANQPRIRAVGRQFGIATHETSLLVLEAVDDYVRHEIEPPAELRIAYDRLAASTVRQRTQSDAARLAQVVRRFEERAAWWNRDFPKGEPPAQLAVAKARAGGALALAESARDAGRPLPATAPSPAPGAPPMEARADDRRLNLGAAGEGAPRERARKEAGSSAGSTSIGIALTPAAHGSASMQRLKAASADARPAVYAEERATNASNVGFFLDAGDFFIEHGQRALGLRILSNLAEMDLQNRQVLRLLAYRLQQAGALEVALPILERVRELAPNEPQSHRDLGLALAEAGQPQRAVELLYAVATGTWDGRFADIELIALAELNAIVDRSGRAGRPLETTAIDARLLRSMPLDVRVVLAWDADLTDVDLHVIDPNGEEVFYGRQLSHQGGAVTRDATGGYGPEEFALRHAKPGIYRIEANFYGHRQQVLTTGTGLMLWLSSGFGTAAQQDRRSTVRVASARGERIVVGQFEVKGLGPGPGPGPGPEVATAVGQR